MGRIYQLFIHIVLVKCRVIKNIVYISHIYSFSVTLFWVMFLHINYLSSFYIFEMLLFYIQQNGKTYSRNGFI